MDLKEKTVVVIAGLPLSGKSSLGRALAAKTGLPFIDIDEGPASCAPPQEPNPMASDDARTREQKRMRVAYTVLHAAIEANLEQGFSVIVAATYSRHGSQDFLKAAVDRQGGILKIILCRYDDTPEEIERRIAHRIVSDTVGGCRSVAHYCEDRSRYAGIKLPHTIAMMNGEDGPQKTVELALAYINS